ncbi:MAG: FkbM family methyltransferase [Acidobacteria bacterium]|nr:FkbM family methyltransferase [Acidobacteriota bacterium]
MTKPHVDSVSRLLFRVPPFPGKGRVTDALAKYVGRRKGGRGFCAPGVGARLEVDLSDRIARQMWGGCYEPHVRRCLETLLQPGDTFVDVGAHIGYLTLLAACRVGAAGRVFAFEADPGLYAKLARNVEQFPWVQAFHAAVWAVSGSMVFERSSFAHESGWGTLTTVRDLGRGEHATVEAMSLDDWRTKSLVEAIRAIKIDAEGSELAILRGAQQSLERFRPSLIVEVNDILLRQAGTSSMELAEFLMRRHYLLFSLSWFRCERWKPSLHADFSDVLCLPEEQAELTLEALHRAGFKRGLR